MVGGGGEPPPSSSPPPSLFGAAHSFETVLGDEGARNAQKTVLRTEHVLSHTLSQGELLRGNETPQEDSAPRRPGPFQLLADTSRALESKSRETFSLNVDSFTIELVLAQVRGLGAGAA